MIKQSGNLLRKVVLPVFFSPESKIIFPSKPGFTLLGVILQISIAIYIPPFIKNLNMDYQNYYYCSFLYWLNIFLLCLLKLLLLKIIAYFYYRNVRLLFLGLFRY